MTRKEMSDQQFNKFQDDFFDLLQENGVSKITCDHPRWNDICDIRNRVAEFIEEQVYLQVWEESEDE